MRTRMLTPVPAFASLVFAPPAHGQLCDPATLFDPASTAVTTTGAPVFEVRVADLNGDGLVDLAATNSNQQNNAVSVALGLAPRAFGPPPDYPTSGVVSPLRLADLDGDGDTDAVAYDVVGSSFVPMLNDGSGALTAQPPAAVASQGIGIFVLADLDNDGDADILSAAIASNQPAAIDVLLNAGDGTFGPAIMSTAVIGRSIIARDMNDDGVIDAIMPNGAGNSIAVMLGNGDGTFGPVIATPVVVPGGGGPTGIDIADFDGDGLLDVAACLNSGEVAVLPGIGGGAFGQTAAYDIGGSVLIDLYAEDLDGDGDQDIATQNIITDEITLLINNGAGIFDASAVLAGQAWAFTLADVDSDGDTDLVSQEQNSNLVFLRRNTCGPFGPVIVSQPVGVLRSLGDPAAVFEVDALNAAAYQWRLDGVDLADDAVFAGAQTDTLTVAAGSRIDGLLDVVVSDGIDPARDATSQPAVLALRNDCPADQNFDGLLTPADFNAWIVNYNAGCP